MELWCLALRAKGWAEGEWLKAMGLWGYGVKG